MDGSQVAPVAVVARAKPDVPDAMARYLSLDDFERVARRVLPRLFYGYISGAAETNAALDEARAAFTDWAFVPRVLADVSGRNIKTTLFGQAYDAPFGIAPMGVSALAAYRGDIALAQAAAAANIPMIMSAASLIRLEDVRTAGRTAWFQGYLAGDDARVCAMVDRVAAAGFDTFVVTADVPVGANRENNIRNGYRVPLVLTPQVVLDVLLHPRWLLSVWLRTWRLHGVPHFENMDATRGPPVVSRDLERNIGARDQLAWPHVALIKRRFPGRVVVKGVLAAEDALMAREHGVDGIIVSSHGGRQLDSAIAPLRALPGIVDVAGDMTVMLDGGIRRGTDVLKALALGAKFVWVGRPMLYAAAAGGEPGVARAIALLAEEAGRDMALLGVTQLEQVTQALLARVPR
jgi:L-lactate dehydrogenase (cytochrome)